MAKTDKAEKKSKKEKPTVVDVDGEGDVSMVVQEAAGVEVVKVSSLSMWANKEYKFMDWIGEESKERKG